jgi:cellulose biosynthesis protein BcsQ
MSEGSIVTFYSYKGGVGRTLALANVGALLCRWGYKVLCVDWDLEAPGLHLYFERWVKSVAGSEDESTQQPGLTELIQAHVDGARPNWREFLTEVRFPKTDQPLQLMTAGRQDSSYIPRMQALEWKRLYDEHQFGNFLEALREEWKQEFDFVLVDSRTGVTDIGGICTVQLPDLLVLLFTANLQSLRGSLDVVRRAKQVRNGLPFTRAKLLVLPVATRFEVRVEYELAQKWLKDFALELGPFYSEWMHGSVTAAELLNHLRVPYIPYWSFGEKLPVIEKGTEDPEDIGFSLETLAAIVAQEFASSDVLVNNRDSYVLKAQKNGAFAGTGDKLPTKEFPPVKVFFSYSSEEGEMLTELKRHLGVLKQQRMIEVVGSISVDQRKRPWKGDEKNAWEHAEIILLLISASYLASDFLFGAEAKQALERHARGEAIIIPVILKPALWEETFLAKSQVLPSPGKAVASWADQDEAFVQVARGIREAALRVRSLGQKKLNPSSTADI